MQADNTETGVQDARQDKIDILLHGAFGVTDANWGLHSAIASILGPYAAAVKKLQTVLQPIPHKVAGTIAILDASLEQVENEQWSGEYLTWRTPLALETGKPELVALIDKLAVAFAAKIREGIRDRFACKSNRKVGDFT